MKNRIRFNKLKLGRYVKIYECPTYHNNSVAKIFLDTTLTSLFLTV